MFGYHLKTSHRASPLSDHAPNRNRFFINSTGHALPITMTDFIDHISTSGKVSTNTGLAITSTGTMPAASSDNKDCLVLYTGTTGTYKTNGVYRSTGTAWTLLGVVSNLSEGTGISISDGQISLSDSGVKAGSTGSVTSVPAITVDAKGRITAISGKTIYPPTTAGTANQYWRSDGSGAGTWTTPATAATSGSGTLVSSGGLYTILNGYVAKVTGKGLSTEDFTSAEKTKLGNLTEGAEKNTIETVKVNNTALTPDSNRAVNIDLSGYGSKPIVKTAVAVAANAWTSNTSVSGYSYRASVAVTGMTANHIPIVTFDAAQARSGNYCPIAETYAGGVYIWSKANTAITIQSIIGIKP